MTETVKVRIAVAVDSAGDWCTWAVSDNDDLDAADEAVASLDSENRTAAYIIEAAIPVPKPGPRFITIPATVSPAAPNPPATEA